MEVGAAGFERHLPLLRGRIRRAAFLGEPRGRPVSRYRRPEPRLPSRPLPALRGGRPGAGPARGAAGSGVRVSRPGRWRVPEQRRLRRRVLERAAEVGTGARSEVLASVRCGSGSS